MFSVQQNDLALESAPLSR